MSVDDFLGGGFMQGDDDEEDAQVIGVVMYIMDDIDYTTTRAKRTVWTKTRETRMMRTPKTWMTTRLLPMWMT